MIEPLPGAAGIWLPATVDAVADVADGLERL